MIKPFTLLLTMSAVLWSSITVAQLATVEDNDMGLAGSVFDTPEPLHFNYMAIDPDDVEKTLPTAFADAPPQIPHSIDKVTPILLTKNKCLKCHDDPKLWNKSKGQGEASPMPKSHYVDFRNTPKTVNKKLIGSRFFCMQCHVPQAEVAPLVENDF